MKTSSSKHFNHFAAKMPEFLNCFWLFINHQLSQACPMQMCAPKNKASIEETEEVWTRPNRC